MKTNIFLITFLSSFATIHLSTAQVWWPDPITDPDYSTGTIQTPTGVNVTVQIMGQEMSAYEENLLTSALSSAFPYAEVCGSSTFSYNCHGYAWYKRGSNGTENFWIEQAPASAYWNGTNGSNYSFVETDESQAEIALSISTNHSLYKVSGNTYISKWGRGPLMLHNIYECPYSSTSLNYYKKYGIPSTAFISGPNALTCEGTYTLTKLPSYNTAITWSVGGATIISGQGTASVTIRKNTTTPPLSTATVSAYSAGDTKNKAITIGIPAAIDGPTSLTIPSGYNYVATSFSASPFVSGGTYTWSVSPSNNVSYSPSGNQLNVSFFQTGTYVVTCNTTFTSCYSSPGSSSKVITVSQ
ncbi:MAG: hypothetical protein LBK65_09880 [Tannerellaceae bacterium]|jgi:hypothetical protein|nr:hypothetical protein [Tannerellaceae bacterium]